MELIERHPILEFSHGREVTFTFDGKELKGFEGEPIAMALHANGVQVYRITPEMKRTRGFFCAIGKCSSCFMVVDGVPTSAPASRLSPRDEGRDAEGQGPRAYGSLGGGGRDYEEGI